MRYLCKYLEAIRVTRRSDHLEEHCSRCLGVFKGTTETEAGGEWKERRAERQVGSHTRGPRGSQQGLAFILSEIRSHWTILSCGMS